MLILSRIVFFAFFLVVSFQAVAISADPPPRVDLFGDPLPQGAIARMGTSRLRHDNTVYDVAFSPDEKQVATAGADGNVCFWDIHSGKLLSCQKFDGTFIWHMSYSRDGSRYVVYDGGGFVTVADTKTHKRLHVINVLDRRGLADFSRDGSKLLTANSDGLQIWQLTDPDENNVTAKRIAQAAGDYEGAIFSPDGTWIAAWTELGIVRMTSDDLKVQFGMGGHFKTIRSVDISPDGKLVASASNDSTFRIWDATNGKELWRETAAHGPSDTSCARFSPDGKMLATAGYDTSVRIWDVAKQVQIRSFNDQFQRRVRWSRDGKTIASFNGNTLRARLRDVTTGKDVPALTGHNSGPAQMQFIDGGKRLVTSYSNDNSLRIWDPRTGKQLNEFSGQVSLTKPVSGTDLFVGTDTCDLSFFNIKSGNRKQVASADREKVLRYWWPATSADGKWLGTVTSSAHIKRIGQNVDYRHETHLETWRLPDKNELPDKLDRQSSTLVEGLRRDIQFLPDKQHVLGLVHRRMPDGKFTEWILAWNRDDLTKPRTIYKNESKQNTNDRIESFAVSPDGTKLAVAHTLRAVLVDIKTVKVIHELPVTNDHNVGEIAFSADGKYVFGCRNKFHVWNVVSGKVVQIGGDDKQRFLYAALSHDNQFLAASNRDGRIHIWDFESHRLLAILGDENMKPARIVFSPDNQFFVAHGNGGSLLSWSLDPKDWPDNLPLVRGLQGMWDDLASQDAGDAYEAARQMINRGAEAIAFLKTKITKDVVLPSPWLLDDERQLQFHRAAFVLDALPLDGSAALRKHIRYAPLPVDAGVMKAVPVNQKENGVVAADIDQLITSLDGSTVLVMSDSQTSLLHPRTFAQLYSLPINGIPKAVSIDGRFCLVKAGWDVVIWEIATRSRVSKLPREFADNQTFAFHANGRHLVGSRRRGTFVTLDFLSGDEVARVEFDTGTYRNLHLLANGKTHIAGHLGVIHFTETATGKRLWSWPTDDDPLVGWRAIRGGDEVAIYQMSLGNIGFYDGYTGKKLRSCLLEKQMRGAVGFSPNGEWVFANEQGKPLVGYETASRKSIMEIAIADLNDAYMLPDGRHLIIDSELDGIAIHDLAHYATKRDAKETAVNFLERLLSDLDGDDGRRAFAATWALVDLGDKAVDSSRAHLLKNRDVPDDTIRGLIVNLDSDDFKQRESAAIKLRSIGVAALKHLEEAAESTKSLEVKSRSKKLIKTIRDNDTNRTKSRISTILRLIGSPSADRLLEEVNGSSPLQEEKPAEG